MPGCLRKFCNTSILYNEVGLYEDVGSVCKVDIFLWGRNRSPMEDEENLMMKKVLSVHANKPHDNRRRFKRQITTNKDVR